VIMKDELSNSFRNRQQCALIAMEVKYIWPDGAARSRRITSQVLQVVAERAARHIREIDFLGRYGENEFAILLPRTDLESANRMADRLRRELTATPVWTDRGPLNLSLGIAVLTPNTARKEASVLLEEAFAEMRRVPRSAVDTPTKPLPSEPFRIGRNR
jgi:diguanylate cyclase (GGDEF)-like protein